MLARGTEWIFLLGAAAALYLITAGAQRAGGFTALIDSIMGGESWSRLAEEYFEPARIALITVWVHLIVAVGPLAAVAATLTTDPRVRRRQSWILGLGLLLALLFSLVFAERLIAFAYVVAAAIAVRPRAVRRGPRGRLGRRAKIQLARRRSAHRRLLGRERVQPHVPGDEREHHAGRRDRRRCGHSARGSALPRATPSQARATACTPVDHLESRQYVFQQHVGPSSRPLAGMMTRRRWSAGGMPSTTGLLNELYPDNNPLTTFPLSGAAFADLGRVGLALMSWIGAGIGAVHARFRRGELWAVFVYVLLRRGDSRLLPDHVLGAGPRWWCRRWRSSC